MAEEAAWPGEDASRGPEGGRAARGALPEPASRAGHRRGVPGRRSSSTPATRCRSNTRWCAGSAWRATRSPRPRRRSGTRGPRYYQAAAALGEHRAGRAGAGQARAARRRHKLTDECCAWAEQRLAADPDAAPGGLVEPIAARFGVRVHPRSIERALARHRERTPKAADLPAHEPRKEDPGPCPRDLTWPRGC